MTIAAAGRRDAAAWGALVGLGLILAADPGVAIALAGLVIAGAIACASPAAALAATLTALPFTAHPFALGARHFSHLEAALLATGLACAVAIARDRSLATARDLLRPWGPTAAAALVAVAGAIATWQAADPAQSDASLRALRTVLLEPLLLLPATRLVARRGEIALPLLGLAAAALAASVWALVQASTGGGVVADAVTRATGPYTHPNALAFFLERAALLLGVVAIWRWRSLVQLALPVAAVILAGLAATFSRGAAIATPAAAIAAAWLAGRRRLAAGAGLAALVGGASFAVIAGERLAASGASDGFSRAPIWRASLRMIRDYPLTGIGPDQFYAMYGPRYIEPAAWAERFTSHPHNLLLDAWLSLGVAGAALVGLFVAWLAVAGWRLRARFAASPADAAAVVALGAWGALLTGLLHGMVDNGYFLADLAAFTWVAVALLADGAGERAR